MLPIALTLHLRPSPGLHLREKRPLIRESAMRTKLSVRNVEAARPFDAPYEIHDTEIKDLLLRVQP